MCTPTRASLLTGRYASRFGRHATVPSNAPVLPDGYPTLPAALRNAGYATGLFGKWHLGSSPEFGPNRFGFDTAYGSLAGGVDPYNHAYKKQHPQWTRTWHRNGELVDEPGHVTDLIAGEAIDWIRRQERPWFCYVPFTAVHVPVKAPHHWMDAYAGGTYDDEPARDRSYKRYAAYTSHMDERIGDLFDALREMNALESTIVVFTSDNGAIRESLHESDCYPGRQETCPRLGDNRPFRGQKAELYEGGIRTPALLQWSGTLARGRIAEPVNIVDWMPTFLSLVSAPAPVGARWDGLDITKLLTEGRSPGERTFYWNFRGGAETAVRQGDWKLIVRTDASQPCRELFNIAEDPYEQEECAARHPDRVAALERERCRHAAMDYEACRPELRS
jgi:arylsulfatase A-like enzyme